MDYIQIHDFNLTEQQMVKIQENLRKGIKFEKLKSKPNYVSGVDAIYSEKYSLAVITTFNVNTSKIIECTYAIEKLTFEYKPGLLAFHELPAFLKAWTNLTIDPNVVVFDGYGYAHPRRAGLATHASFFINKPTFGIAKSPFIGNFEHPRNNIGDYTSIYYKDEVIGIALRTLGNSKPIYLSAGNYITLDEIIEIIKKFIVLNNRIPLITSVPDKLSKKLKYLIN